LATPLHGGDKMDEALARARLETERREVQQTLLETDAAGRQDRVAENETGDVADRAQPLAAEGVDDAIAAGLRGRLSTIERALRRLDANAYGRSIRSGVPIPDERLDADPAAELTVEEAAAAS
jgi:DnaK suppressor protein